MIVLNLLELNSYKQISKSFHKRAALMILSTFDGKSLS